jgi:hypothetical protein
MGLSGQLQAAANLSQGKEPRYPLVGGWLGIRADLEAVATRKNSCLLSGIETRSSSL